MSTATVSIVSHGHGAMVTELLCDLAHQTIAGSLEVILTLNIPEAEPDPAQFAGLPLRIVRNVSPKGFGANHNAALRNATTPWVMIVNPDIRIRDRGLLQELMARRVDSGLGLVAPVIRNSAGSREDSIRHNLDPLSLFVRAILRRKTILIPDAATGRFRWVAGMFMALPRSVWEDVAGFDERFFLYCEDYDLCARLAERRYAIEVDEAVEAVHDAQRSSGKSLKYLSLHVSSLLKVWGSGHFWRIWAADLQTIRRHG